MGNFNVEITLTLNHKDDGGYGVFLWEKKFSHLMKRYISQMVTIYMMPW